MKQRIIIIISIIVLLGIGFTGGWFAKTKMGSRGAEVAQETSNQFLSNLAENKVTEAYEQMSPEYRQAVTQDDFANTVKPLSNDSLEPGISTNYVSDKTYLYLQEYIDKDGKTTTVAAINLAEQDSKIYITGISFN